MLLDMLSLFVPCKPVYIFMVICKNRCNISLSRHTWINFNPDGCFLSRLSLTNKFTVNNNEDMAMQSDSYIGTFVSSAFIRTVPLNRSDIWIYSHVALDPRIIDTVSIIGVWIRLCGTSINFHTSAAPISHTVRRNRQIQLRFVSRSILLHPPAELYI